MNQDEFEQRIEALRPHLLAAARRRLPQDESEDAVQSAVLSAWEHLPALRDENAFDGWVYRILENQCRQTLRRLRRSRALLRPLDAQTGQASAGDVQPELGSALESLSDEDRRLLLLHHEQGYSLGELSQMTGQSKGALGMRMMRARKRLRMALISLLLIALLLAAAAFAAEKLGVNWFLLNRRASSPEPYGADGQADGQIAYSGALVAAEVCDVIWDMDSLSLLLTYSIAGTDAQALTVHGGCLGVDGERHDHIWTDEGIMPVAQWAQGKPVHVFTLDGWQISGLYPTGSEDFLTDGLGESFFAELRLDSVTPQRYEALLEEDGTISLSCAVSVRDYDSGDVLEEGALTLRVSAPGAEKWREAYEARARSSDGQ